jgi:hypothetical protein
MYGIVTQLASSSEFYKYYRRNLGLVGPTLRKQLTPECMVSLDNLSAPQRKLVTIFVTEYISLDSFDRLACHSAKYVTHRIPDWMSEVGGDTLRSLFL